MTDQSFHDYLRSACPISGGDLMAEIQLLRKCSPTSAEGLPENAVELSAAINRLVIRGLLEKRSDGLVYWKVEPVKVEPQLLF